MALATSLSAIGSSPRLRGTVSVQAFAFPFSRFIPAPAGNGFTDSVKDTGRPVHPRACGERCHRDAHEHSQHGSSPRLRGTVQTMVLPNGLRRFIPAPAGNGVSTGIRYPTGAVHPRACGERLQSALLDSSQLGSSPRLRGTGENLSPGSSSARFIPAPAGNGCPRPHQIRRTPVHPRACGERSIRRMAPC